MIDNLIHPGIPKHEHGVEDPFISFDSLTEIKKTFGELQTNYMYVNNCDKTMEPQDVLNIVLSTSIHDAEMNPIGNVISSLTD